MTASLTPALALAYLRELSTDIRAAVVLDAQGEPLAGDAALAVPALELLAAAQATADPSSGVRIARGAGEALLAAGGDGGLAIAVVAGKRAQTALLAHDIRAALDDLIPRHS